MYLILTCHVEVDRANQYGDAKRINLKAQSLSHVSYFLSLLSKYDIPITLSLTVGGQAGKNLLKLVSKEMLSSNFELSIHFHFEKYDESKGKWIPGKITEEKIKNRYEAFYRILGFYPTSAVFGHWIINGEILKWIRNLGLKVDGSYVPYRHNDRFVIKNPFKWEGILEVPVTSDGKYPLNPFTCSYHFDVVKHLIRRCHDKDVVLHLGFHSYDFFDFSDGKPQIRNVTVKILESLISYIKECDLQCINLSDTLRYDFDPYIISRIPLRATLSRYVTLFREHHNKKV
jgi:hypothetical protein